MGLQEMGLRPKPQIDLGAEGSVGVWAGNCEDVALEEMRGQPRMTSLLADEDVRPWHLVFVLEPRIEEWPTGCRLLCASDRQYHPAVTSWRGGGLLLVSCGFSCWGVRTRSGTIAFRHVSLYPLRAEILPGGRRALVAGETYLDCLEPSGEVVWSWDVGHPYSYQVCEDGTVRVRDVLAEVGNGVSLDARTGLPRGG